MNRHIRTELLKLRTTRTHIIGVAAAPALAGLATVAILGAAGKQDNDPLGPDSLVQAVGAPAAAIPVIALLLGVLGMAGEHRHETITTTFLASPRRRDVVMAKLAAFSLAGLVMGSLSVLTSAAIAVPWLRSSEVAISLDAQLLRVAAGLILSAGLYAALGVSIGALVRNQTLAVSAVLVWLLAVEGVIVDLLGASDLVRWLPAAAGRALTAQPGTDLSLPVAAAVFTAYVAAFTVAAVRLTLSRDIT